MGTYLYHHLLRHFPWSFTDSVDALACQYIRTFRWGEPAQTFLKIVVIGNVGHNQYCTVHNTASQRPESLELVAACVVFEFLTKMHNTCKYGFRVSPSLTRVKATPVQGGNPAFWRPSPHSSRSPKGESFCGKVVVVALCRHFWHGWPLWLSHAHPTWLECNVQTWVRGGCSCHSSSFCEFAVFNRFSTGPMETYWKWLVRDKLGVVE